jgi:putative transposase
VVFLDAIVVKVRDHHVVCDKPAYLAVGIDTDGDQHVLGIWVPKTSDSAAGPAAGQGAGEGSRSVITGRRLHTAGALGLLRAGVDDRPDDPAWCARECPVSGTGHPRLDR